MSARDFEPFGPNGTFLLTEQRLEALSRLLFVIENRRNLAVVSGPAGVGKTRLLDELQQQCRAARRRFLRVDASGLTPDEFPDVLLAACQVWPDARGAWSCLDDVITGRGMSSGAGVWIIDHVDQAADDLAAPLSRLVQQLGRREIQGTAIVATADPELLGSLIERTGWRIELSAWTAEDAAAALELMQGSAPSPHFSSAAIRVVAEAANGSPELTMQLCELSALAAKLHGADLIDADLVREACRQRTLSHHGDFWLDSDEHALATLWRD